MHMRSENRRELRILLGLAIVLYLILCTLYLWAIPPGESPDEPSHLQCIEQVSMLHRLPIVDPLPRGLWWTRERVISGLTCYHLPLYYLAAGYTQRVVAALTKTSLHYEFPPTDSRFATGASVAMFAHPPRTHVLGLREPFTLTILRLGSILFGLGMLWSAHRLVRRLTPNLPYAPILAVTLMAGWPQFIFMSRAINNDALAIPLAAMALGALVGDERPRRYIVASVLIAGAILAKVMSAFAAVVIVLSWIVEWLNAGLAGQRRKLLRAGIISLLIFVALIVLLSCQPTLRNNVLATIKAIAPGTPAASTAVYWSNVARTTLQSGWGRFGWMNLATPDAQVYIWWAFLAITVLRGLVAAIRRCAPKSTFHTLLICGLWSLGTLATYGQIQVNRFQPQFRYAFALLPILTAFAGIGIATLCGQSVYRQRLAFLLLWASLLSVNLWIVFAIIVPAYP